MLAPLREASYLSASHEMSFRSAMCRNRDLHGYPDKRRTTWPFRVGRLASNPGSIRDEGGHPGPRPDLEHLGRGGRGRRVRHPPL